MKLVTRLQKAELLKKEVEENKQIFSEIKRRNNILMSMVMAMYCFICKHKHKWKGFDK